jgi:hypothetical protein
MSLEEISNVSAVKVEPLDVKTFELADEFMTKFTSLVDSIELNLSINPNLGEMPPRPNLLFIDSAEVNAFVQNAYVCYVAKDSKLASNDIGLIYQEKVGLLDIEFSECQKIIEIENISTDAGLSFVKENAPDLIEEGCNVNFEKDLLEYSCDDFQQSYSFLAVDKVPNWIMVTKGMVDKFKDSTQFLTVVSHELAHYYMGHTGQYRWTPFLDTNEGRLEGSPVEFESGYDLLYDLEDFNNVKMEKKLNDTVFEPELFTFLKEVTNIESCTCLKDHPVEGLLLYADIESEGMVLNYQEFEKSLLSCANSMIISNLDPKSKLNLRLSLTTSISSPRLLDDMKNYFEASENLPDGSTVSDLLNKISSDVLKIKNKISLFRAKARYLKLSFYTNEQQADEVALEYLSYLDSSLPYDAPEFFLGFLGDGDKKNACEAGIEKVKAGEEFYWEIEDWTTPHHSSCYRAVNLQKELYFHSY